jgi:hypothetical protein
LIRITPRPGPDRKSTSSTFVSTARASQALDVHHLGPLGEGLQVEPQAVTVVRQRHPLQLGFG